MKTIGASSKDCPAYRSMRFTYGRPQSVRPRMSRWQRGQSALKYIGSVRAAPTIAATAV
jgi:hypothetical protein